MKKPRFSNKNPDIGWPDLSAQVLIYGQGSDISLDSACACVCVGVNTSYIDVIESLAHISMISPQLVLFETYQRSSCFRLRMYLHL